MKLSGQGAWACATPENLAVMRRFFCQFNKHPASAQAILRGLVPVRWRLVPCLHVVAAFNTGQKLHKAFGKQRLEGVVSKRPDAPDRPGGSRDWMSIKTTAWREANWERWHLSECALEWEGKSRFAVFDRNDKCATVRLMSVADRLAHHRSLFVATFPTASKP